MALPFHIVDVFAERRYAGNPLAVVLRAEQLSDETMQRIATETNFSETTFVATDPEPDGAFGVRIFTPARELAFAGHPLVGTAWVIREAYARGAAEPLRLNIAAGRVPVTFERSEEGGEVTWFVAPPVTLGATCGREDIAVALGLAREDIASGPPVQLAGASSTALLVPVRDLAALRIEQGYGLHRPSCVRLRARGAGAAREVRVGGSVVPVARGEWLTE